jgi:hypothetical protein
MDSSVRRDADKIVGTGQDRKAIEDSWDSTSRNGNRG